MAATTDREVIPEDLPAAPEARRIRGLAVPAVAAAVVVGIGWPLTALAVSQIGSPTTVGPSPQRSGPAVEEGASGAAASRGRAHLEGAVTFDGPVTPLACGPAAPRLATLDAPAGRFTILVSLPAETAAGTYPLQPTAPTFVALTRVSGGSQTWSSFAKAGSTGDVTVHADGWVTARFRGLEPNGGGAEGSVDGTVEVDCG